MQQDASRRSKTCSGKQLRTAQRQNNEPAECRYCVFDAAKSCKAGLIESCGH